MTPVSPVLPNAFAATEYTCGEHQPPYLPLPAVKGRNPDGMITTRWSIPWSDRFRILFSGSIWVQLLTFHNKVQPIKLLSEEPNLDDCIGQKAPSAGL